MRDSNDSEIDDIEIFSNHSRGTESVDESDIELEADDIPPVPEVSKETIYVGKNKYVWTSLEPSKRKRTAKRNIITQLPGLRGNAKSLGDNPKEIEVWDLLFDEIIITEIIVWTNIKISEMRCHLDDPSKVDYTDTNPIEMRAFLGLLLFTSIFKSGRETMESLFATSTKGRPIFRATMSIKRFQILTTCLRFDDPATRETRKETDKAAAISFIFQAFLANSQNNFSLGSYVCIDEMLVAFRGKCGFKMYMPSKPAKYGLKLMCMTDARNHYFYNAYLYVGKDSDGYGLGEKEKSLQKPTQSVLKLTKPIHKSNRNVTADNWFTSVELAKELIQKGLTYVGTIKKNRREIPIEFLANKNRPIKSSLYGLSEDKLTLLSYVPKKNRAVLLLSTMHDRISQDDSGLPEIISFYNTTKGGVDALDMKCSNYSSNRRTRRWPMALFYRLVDICANNSYVLYIHYKNTPVKSRFDFIDNLATDLVKPHIQQRLLNPRMPRELKSVMEASISISQKRKRTEMENTKTDKLAKPSTCSNCDYRKKRKTNSKCVKCSVPICLECSRKLCVNCVDQL